MSKARDKKMKLKRRLDEEMAIKITRACRFRRYDEIRLALLFLCSKKFYYILKILGENVIESNHESLIRTKNYENSSR